MPMEGRFERQKNLLPEDISTGVKVGIVGLGGLGTHLLWLLAQLGFKRFLLVDRDRVEPSNLNRQGIYTPKDIGKPKIDAAREWLKRFLPDADAEIKRDIDEEILNVDIVFDCLDNVESRKKLLQIVTGKKPLIVGSVWEKKALVAFLPENYSKFAEDLIINALKDWEGDIIAPTCALGAILMVNALLEYLLHGFRVGYVERAELNKRRERVYIPLAALEPEVAALKVSEIAIKSKVSRAKLMNLLVENLKERGIAVYSVEGGVVFASPNPIKILEATFGAAKIELGIKVPLDIEKIKEAALRVFWSFPGGTFRITASRSWKGFKYTSLEIERLVGEYVRKRSGAGVKLKNPETEIIVEIYKDFAFVTSNHLVFKGPGGLSLGSQGKAIALVSGGFDSPVALYLAGRRGIKPVILHFTPNEEIRAKVMENLKRLKRFFGKLRVYIGDGKKLFKFIKENIPEGYRQIFLKIAFYQAAEMLGKRENAVGIITGESIGQTSSQTLPNLAVIESFISLPVIRPLAGFTKEESIELAKKIGTYEISSTVKEFCRLETHSIVDADLKEVRKLYRKVDFEKFVEELFSGLKIVEL